MSLFADETFEDRIQALFDLSHNIIDHYVSKDGRWSNIIFDNAVMNRLSGSINRLLRGAAWHKDFRPTIVYQHSTEGGALEGEPVRIKVVLYHGGEFPFTSELFSVTYVKRTKQDS